MYRVTAENDCRPWLQRGYTQVGQNAVMPSSPSKRLRPIAIGLTLWEIYWRLPPRQRRFLIGQVRKHGPKAAKTAYKAATAKRR